MTYTEKKQPSFGVNEGVYILDTQIYDKPTWIHGVVQEVGDESILVKWGDLEDPTEYELSDLPDIRHHQPEGEKVEEFTTNMQLKIGKLEVNCFDEDGEMSIRVGNSRYQSLSMDEAKELAHFLQSHIHHESEANND